MYACGKGVENLSLLDPLERVGRASDTFPPSSLSVGSAPASFPDSQAPRYPPKILPYRYVQ